MMSLVMPYRLHRATEIITTTADCPCAPPEEKVMSLSVSAVPEAVATLEPTMESFVHLRKGKTPRRLHADLDGLKDDELGRGGFTGRTANMYRRHDPTAYRAEGPLRPIDVLCSDLKPSDATDANGGPLLMFSNDDCRVLLETEFGPLGYREGDWVYIPKACTWRQVPERETTLLMIEATDEFRVPPPGSLGRHFPFDPSQAVIP